MQESINSKSMLKVGTILRGIYRIDSYLSSGGFGNTYVATNIEFEERVAIKEFFMKGVTQRDDNQTTVSVSNADNKDSFVSQREKFKKEARRLRKLKNKYIVSVHDLFEENGTAYYVMDYVDGENLAERLKRTGQPMNEQDVREILPQILDALKAVHDAGIWHLDLKPANVMVDKSGNVKLIDFGASKQMNAKKGGATTSTAISYTNGYAPREQMEQNYDKFGPWTDIYALGATLYNLLTNNRPPLPSDIDDDESSDKHQSLPFTVGVSENMKQLVLQLMSTNRKERPQSIGELLSKIDFQSSNSGELTKKPDEEKVSAFVDGEATIIASTSEETYIEQQPKQEEKTNSESASAIYYSTEPDTGSFDEESGITNGTKIILAVLIGIIVIFVIIGGRGCGNTAQVPVESIVDVDTLAIIKEVNLMQCETGQGSCKYSGPIDDNNRPDGYGEAFFNDGRYYKGGFEHGVLSGDDCYFKYPEGDEFKGQFRRNYFYYGRYTVAKDKSYFIGYFDEKGQIAGGTWYDRNGKVIQ